MVELRSRTHLHSQLHSIRTITDGSIKILLNVVAKGKSKLKFRQLVDVYNQGNTEDDESIPIVVRDLDNVSDMTQGSVMFVAEADIKTEPEDFSLTLEKIRKQCKEKKRKLRNRGDAVTASQVKVKQESLTEDEGCDLEEPLSSWNTKFSKRRKKKQEGKTKCSSTSSPSAKKVDLLPVFHDVKPETWDDSYSVPEAMDFIPTDPLLVCNKEPESTSNTELVEEIIHDLPKDTTLALYCTSAPNFPGMVTTEELITTNPVDKDFEDASEEFIKARKARCCLVDNLAIENQENVLCGSVSREAIKLETPQSSESETIGGVKNLIYSNTSSGTDEVIEDEESNYSKPNLDMAITGLEIVKIEAPEILATDYSGLLPMEFGVEDTQIVWENEDIAKDEFPEATDILQLTSCCNSLENLHLVSDDSPVSLEEDHLPERLQQSSSSGNVDEAEDYKSSQLFQAPEEVKTAEETDSIQQQELHSQPEKLLSGRKALSPTSQAKLRKAMEHPDTPEKRCTKSKGKLYFSSLNAHRILKAQGLDSIDRVEVISNSKQAIRKANNNTRQTQYQRATHKSPRRETQAAKPQPFSTGRTSLQGCTQKAITFSQGQVRDFQFVAAKLTKELKSMRQITKRCLLAEGNPSNMSDCDLDEVKALIGNAEKTEQSSKKWLSMIERDCNRFCKLMGMVREDSPATENIVQKTKKIRFADDAGGDLCHVKVFDLDLESVS
ncbi:hypothetical protein EUTSA_v10005811mg [Eutrema salsugineum]|uniref:Uncharacterized protein n=1 Tax=Eutrema salsugineum TaxID=72664 RepID=V4LPH7_EUTSA|nr:uncharacterized protein LOC18020040 [Eutrema salsugineum]ESQ44392.1 hypothetical protein EUTSA_v10005811mg [Eutrema salsugineum]